MSNADKTTTSACAQDEYMQVGVMAMRAPDGTFMPSVPLYIRATPADRAKEQQFIGDIGRLFADKMRQYQREVARLNTRKEAAL